MSRWTVLKQWGLRRLRGEAETQAPTTSSAYTNLPGSAAPLTQLRPVSYWLNLTLTVEGPVKKKSLGQLIDIICTTVCYDLLYGRPDLHPVLPYLIEHASTVARELAVIQLNDTGKVLGHMVTRAVIKGYTLLSLVQIQTPRLRNQVQREVDLATKDGAVVMVLYEGQINLQVSAHALREELRSKGFHRCPVPQTPTTLLLNHIKDSQSGQYSFDIYEATSRLMNGVFKANRTTVANAHLTPAHPRSVGFQDNHAAHLPTSVLSNR